MDLTAITTFPFDFENNADLSSSASSEEDSFQFVEGLDWSVISTPPFARPTDPRSESPVVHFLNENNLGLNAMMHPLAQRRTVAVKRDLSAITTHPLKGKSSLATSQFSSSEVKESLGSTNEKKRKAESPDSDDHQSNSKKRHRRKAQEIEREHCCPIEGCSKAYGSEGALKMHMRLKHPDASLKNGSLQLPAPLKSESGAETTSSPSKEARRQSESTSARPAKEKAAKHTSPAESKAAPSSFKPAIEKQPTPSSLPVAEQPGVIENEICLFGGPNPTVQFLDIPMLALKLGSWQKNSKSNADLMATFFFAEKKIAWELASERSFFKMELPFSSLIGLDYQLLANGIVVLGIATKCAPYFYRYPVQPSQTSEWISCVDFTGGYGFNTRLHVVFFAPSALPMSFEQLLQKSPELQALSEIGLPVAEQPEFLLATMEPPLLPHESKQPFFFEALGKTQPISPNDTSSAMLSECSIEHRNEILTLSMHETINLPCCNEPAQLRQLLSLYPCKCNITYFYSFCLRKVVSSLEFRHCPECSKCTSISNSHHCSECSACVKPFCECCANFLSL